MRNTTNTMKTSTEQFTKSIKLFFHEHSGMTITQAKAKIKEQMKADRYNSDIKASNVRLFYTDNPNYKQGKMNNGGVGFYLTSVSFTGGSEIKL